MKKRFTCDATKSLKKKGFTLIELIVVVVLVGISAAFVIPNFTRAHERSIARKGLLNLTTIHSSLVIYKSRNNGYPVSGNLASINTSLKLGIYDTNFTYTLTTVGATYTATAARVGGAYDLTITEAALGAANPTCADSGGTCPTGL